MKRIALLLACLMLFFGCGGGGGDGSGGGGEPTNTAPTADDISIRSDLTSPYIRAQLSGSDADNDTLIYVLDAPIEGVGYEQAFVESNTGRFFATLRNDGVNEIELPYKVSDGTLFSDAASVTIAIGDIADGGIGSNDIPVDEYGRLEIAFFDGDRFGAAPGSAPTLPISIDLSSNFPTPGNQGPQSSCVGWATAYALKSYQEKIDEQWSFSNETTFSPAWIYNQINGGQDSGSRIDYALQLIVDHGAATWQTMPYNDWDFSTQPSSAAIAEAAGYKGIGYERIGGVQQIKAALSNRQPVVIGIVVYENFDQLFGNNAVYNSTSGNLMGGHAVTIVGYDDSRFGGAFKVINSWGLNWGENGFFWIPYNMVSVVMRQSYVLIDGPNTSVVSDVPVVPVQDDLPNLQVVSWSANYNAQPGGQGEWLWEVINAGSTVAAQGADVNLVLSLDNKLDSSDWLVVYEEIPFDLEPGGSAYRDEVNPRPFIFPETLSPGTYYMAVWVDDLQEVDESNENDNQSFGSEQVKISLPALPDLAIDYWWASWNTSSGDGVLEYTVINNGTAPTTNTNWDINLVLSENENSAIGNHYFLFYEHGIFILNPGATIYRDINNQAWFNLFQTQGGFAVPSGTYYMSLWVDDLDQEEECNEINNFSTGNNLVTIYGGYSSKSSQQERPLKALSLDGKGNEVTSNFNGKRLPEGNLLMRKVEITEQPNGTRRLAFVEDGTQMIAQETSDQSDIKTYEKVMKPADYAVFPRSARHMMPEILEATHEK